MWELTVVYSISFYFILLFIVNAVMLLLQINVSQVKKKIYSAERAPTYKITILIGHFVYARVVY